MKLLVDYRETEVIPRFEKFLSSGKSPLITGIEVGKNISGDVHTPDCLVGIERKYTDYMESVYNKQLEKQLIELKQNFIHPFLFIEYEGLTDLIMKNKGTNPKVVAGSLASIMARHQVTVMFVGRLYVPFTCRVIEKFYDLKNPVKEYSPIRRGKKKAPVRREASPQEVKLDIISRLPNVGAKKGTRLLEHFNYSISEIARAPTRRIMDVEGFGEKLATKIKEVLS